MDLIGSNSRLIFNSLIDPIYIIDKDFHVIDYNKAFADHHNLSRKMITGKLCYKITHNSEVPCGEMNDAICPAKVTFEKNERFRSIHRHIIGDKIIIEEVISTPIENGKYLLMEFRDVSGLLGIVQGVFPICASCKKIQDNEGNWHKFENYIHKKTGADFSHLICPKCAKKLYPDLLK